MTASRETEEPSVKALCALFIVTTVSALLADAMPALAADLPDDRAPAPNVGMTVTAGTSAAFRSAADRIA
jgi:hypothetical protein